MRAFFMLSLSLSLSLSLLPVKRVCGRALCLEGCAHPLHRSERERKGERGREREREGERGRERLTNVLKGLSSLVYCVRVWPEPIRVKRLSGDILLSRLLGPYSQHYIFFITCVSAQ